LGFPWSVLGCGTLLKIIPCFKKLKTGKIKKRWGLSLGCGREEKETDIS
jgi:hypothetical protein